MMTDRPDARRSAHGSLTCRRPDIGAIQQGERGQHDASSSARSGRTRAKTRTPINTPSDDARCSAPAWRT